MSAQCVTFSKVVNAVVTALTFAKSDICTILLVVLYQANIVPALINNVAFVYRCTVEVVVACVL